MKGEVLFDVALKLSESIGSVLVAYLAHVGAKRFLAEEVIVVLSDEGKLSLTCDISLAKRLAAGGEAWVAIKDMSRYVEMAAAINGKRSLPFLQPPLLDPAFFSLGVECTELLIDINQAAALKSAQS